MGTRITAPRAIDLDGTKIRLTQEAYYAAENGQMPRYSACGVDDAGVEYRVTWFVKDEYWDVNDQGAYFWIEGDHPVEPEQHCDWDEPDEIEEL
jgi:hypothetical protein